MEWTRLGFETVSLVREGGSSSMRAATIGLDTSKHLFQVHGVDATGRMVLRRRLRRNQLVAYFANLPCCVIGLEASGGAHYWARTLSRLGHTVRLMAPQFVRPYVKSNKNDAQDAEAICKAVGRPTMRFVPAKQVGQQDWQLLHRVRSRLIGMRTQLSNQICGLLAEYGIVIPRTVGCLRAVAVEDGAGLVPGEEHGDAFGTPALPRRFDRRQPGRGWPGRTSALRARRAPALTRWGAARGGGARRRLLDRRGAAWRRAGCAR